MADLSSIGNDPSSIAVAATALDAQQAAIEVDAAALKLAIEAQSQAVLALLQSMGLGQQLDLLA